MTQRRRNQLLQAAVVGAGVVPLAVLGVWFARDDLGANPIETITHLTGDWTLRLLLLTLAVTPARRLLGWSAIAPLRRTLGLLAFGYGCLHMLTYVGLDQLFEWSAIVEDVRERRYVTAGLVAFLSMVPLAATSTRGMMKRLGQRWVSLHKLVYVAGIAGVVHYLWLVKADLLAPGVHAGILALLLGYRAWRRFGPETARVTLQSRSALR